MPWVRDAASAIADDLRGGYGIESADVDGRLSLLHEAAGRLRNRALDSAMRSRLDEIVGITYHQMASSTGQVQTAARRLYTDACILRALDDVQHFVACSCDARALSAIAHLDYAIVIAGAAGEGRRDFITDLIKLVQQTCLKFPINDLRSDSSSADDLETYASPHRLQSTPDMDADVALAAAAARVPRIRAPSMASFVSTLSRAPFVLSGFITDWPAMTNRPWASFKYLRAVAGPGRVVPVEVGKDYRESDWSQRMMPWDEFLRSLEQGKGKDVLYLAQHNLLMQFPALRDDILVPDYVYASLTPPGDYPSYNPPRNEEQLVMNAWLGPAGTISPAHTDPYYNFYAQVTGHKTVWLAPPSATPYMYAYPLSGSSEQPHNPAANNTDPSLSNTSRVDVFASDNPDARSKYTLFWEHVAPLATVVTLAPGDLLFFPPGWWHAMRSEKTSFSVSMWF